MRPGTILISRDQCRLPLRHCLLTFDDGPAGRVTEDLLAVLNEFEVKACFCLVGSQVAHMAGTDSRHRKRRTSSGKSHLPPSVH